MMKQAVMFRTDAEAPDEARALAFRTLAERHLDASYRLARVVLTDPSEGEDAVHDAFVTAWTHWSSLRDPALFERWFQRIVVNTCRNRLRRGTRSQVGDISVEVSLQGPDDYSRSDDRDAMDVALARLGPEDRIVPALRYDRDLKVDEIARVLELRPGTVMSRLHRAVGRLRAVLEAPERKEGSR